MPFAVNSRFRHLTPFVLVLLLVVQLYCSLRSTSVTVDEFAHLPAGVVYLQQREFAPYHHNPPLLRMLAALPLLWFEVDTSALEAGDDRWTLGLNFLHFNRADYHELFMAARMPMIGLTIMTAMLLYYWTERVSGYGPATVALTLFCFSPTILAHGGLVTTDTGFSLLFLLSIATFACFVRRLTWPRTLLLGLVIGLAQLAKFTAIIIYPLLLLGWIIVFIVGSRKKHRQRNREGLEGVSASRSCLHLAVVVAVSLLVINAGYLFAGTGRTLGRLSFENPLLASLAESPLGGLPAPLPTEYLRGFDAQYQEAQGAFMAFFLGEHSAEGWLHYYAVALLVKLPFPLFVMLGATVYLMWRGSIPRSPLLLTCLAIPTFSVVVFSVLTNINLGIRYLLFILPLLHIAAGHLAIAAQDSRRVKVLLVGCLVWYTGSSLAQYPYYLSYFSDIVGRAGNGHRLLADSNIDWGQDLIHLRAEMEQRGIESIALAHFGLVDPGVYGIPYEPLSPAASAPVAAVSLNLLLGIDPWGQGRHLRMLEGSRQIGRVGYSIYLFERSGALAAGEESEDACLP